MIEELLMFLSIQGILMLILLWYIADTLVDIERELKEIKEKLTLIIHFKELKESLSQDYQNKKTSRKER